MCIGPRHVAVQLGALQQSLVPAMGVLRHIAAAEGRFSPGERGHGRFTERTYGDPRQDIQDTEPKTRGAPDCEARAQLFNRGSSVQLCLFGRVLCSHDADLQLRRTQLVAGVRGRLPRAWPHRSLIFD